MSITNAVMGNLGSLIKLGCMFLETRTGKFFTVAQTRVQNRHTRHKNNLLSPTHSTGSWSDVQILLAMSHTRVGFVPCSFPSGSSSSERVSLLIALPHRRLLFPGELLPVGRLFICQGRGLCQQVSHAQQGERSGRGLWRTSSILRAFF